MLEFNDEIDEHNNKMDFIRFVRKIHLKEYKEHLDNFLNKFNELNSNIQIDEPEGSIKNCIDLVIEIVEKERNLELHKFQSYNKLIYLVETLKKEQNKQELYTSEKMQYILSLTELIIEFLKERYKELEIKVIEDEEYMSLLK